MAFEAIAFYDGDGAELRRREVLDSFITIRRRLKLLYDFNDMYFCDY